MSRTLIAYHISLFTLLLLVAAGTNISAKSLPDSSSQKAPVNNKPYLTREFEVDGPGILKVFTLSGNIEVEHVPNTNKVRVELYVDRGFAFWSNTKNLDNYRITTFQRGNEIVASVEQKSKETGFFSDQMKFSYKVYLPASMSTQLKSSGGNIKVSGVKGDHLIKTSGGNIDLHEISGKIAVYTSGGNIGIRGSNGTIHAQTEGGNMTISNSSGELRLRTNGGEISAEQISGSMLAKVEGGNIRADFRYVSQGISLETTAGNIVLNVPENKGYDVYLRGTHIQLPTPNSFKGTQKTHLVDGVINGGGASVNLVTEFGNITLHTKND